MFNYYGSRDTNGDPDILYYNASIVNGRVKQGDSNTDPIVSFNETREAPILKDASKYEMSIVRFTADGVGLDLPMFIPRIILGQADINKTEYVVSLQAVSGAGTIYTPNANGTFGGGVHVPNAQQNLVWTTEDDNAPLPREPQTEQDLDGRYYYCNNFQTFVNMFNTALEQAYQALNTAGAGLTTQPPVLKYNKSTKRFTLYCDSEGMGEYSNGEGSSARQVTERLRIFVNSDLWGLLSHFNHKINGGDDTTQEMSYELIPIFDGSPFIPLYNNADPQVAQVQAIPLEQDYSSIDTLWSPIGAIVFTTSLLPVINEYTGEPLRFGESNDVTSGTTANEFTPIITDISLPTSSPADYKGFMEYVPSAEYRMMALSQSAKEIKNIDIRVFWRDRLTNKLNPIRLYPQSSISVKILFRKKSAN